MTGQAFKLVVIGDITYPQYKSALRKLRRFSGKVEVVRLPADYFPVWEEGYELFFLNMGRSAMDDVAISEKYDCSQDEAYTALWEAIATANSLKVGEVAGVVFPLDLGWVPDDMAELFMSHLPKEVALQNIFPITDGRILFPDTPKYNGIYRMFPDCPETTLEI